MSYISSNPSARFAWFVCKPELGTLYMSWELSITRKRKVFGFSFSSRNHGILDNPTCDDVAVFVEFLQPLFFRPLFILWLPNPIQELVRHWGIQSPRLCFEQSELAEHERTRVLFGSSSMRTEPNIEINVQNSDEHDSNKGTVRFC